MEKLVCPHCRQEMRFTTFLKAPTPWHLKCSHCQTKLKLEKYNLHALFIAFLIGIVTGIGLSYYDADLTVAVLVFAVIVIVFEYLFFISMRKLGVGLTLRL